MSSPSTCFSLEGAADGRSQLNVRALERHFAKKVDDNAKWPKCIKSLPVSGLKVSMVGAETGKDLVHWDHHFSQIDVAAGDHGVLKSDIDMLYVTCVITCCFESSRLEMSNMRQSSPQITSPRRGSENFFSCHACMTLTVKKCKILQNREAKELCWKFRAEYWVVLSKILARTR